MPASLTSLNSQSCRGETNKNSPLVLRSSLKRTGGLTASYAGAFTAPNPHPHLKDLAELRSRGMVNGSFYFLQFFNQDFKNKFIYWLHWVFTATLSLVAESGV